MLLSCIKIGVSTKSFNETLLQSGNSSEKHILRLANKSLVTSSIFFSDTDCGFPVRLAVKPIVLTVLSCCNLFNKLTVYLAIKNLKSGILQIIGYLT